MLMFFLFVLTVILARVMSPRSANQTALGHFNVEVVNSIRRINRVGDKIVCSVSHTRSTIVGMCATAFLHLRILIAVKQPMSCLWGNSLVPGPSMTRRSGVSTGGESTVRLRRWARVPCCPCCYQLPSG